MASERASKRRRLSPTGDQGRSLPGFATWNLEQNYERRNRKDKNKKKNESDRLPVKSQESGRWEQDHTREPEVNDEQDSFFDSDEEEERDSGVADLQSRPRAPKRTLPFKDEVRQAKEELAKIASQISESPDEHIGLLGSLAQLSMSRNATVKKLALATQLAVYKNVVPGYRIRPLGKDDAAAKVSKDIKKLRTFEQTLLRSYQSYVQALSKLARRSDDGDDGGVKAVVFSCACSLLTDLPHFNYRNEIIGVIVEKVSARIVDDNFVKCREALEQLFRDEEEGHASLEAVSQVTRMMKSKNYQINETLLNTFLHLRLLSEFAHKASTNRVDRDDQANDQTAKVSKKKREFRSKRERKLVRERKEVEKEMREADAVVSYEERDKNQSETLKLIFVAYFRILKARTPHLMGAVLEGLAKYAHLINQDFFGDILEALKDLIRDSTLEAQDVEHGEEADQQVNEHHNRSAVRESLLCIITAFALLQGQQDVAKSANSLHLDLSFFITHLYRTLLPLAMDQDIELSSKSTHLADPNGLHIPEAKDNKVNVATTTVLLLRSLQAVLLPPTATKMVPPVRIAAFVKQLLTASLHMPQKSAVAVSGLLQQVTKVHSAKISSLWNTEERKGDGVFDALSAEYDSSNPFASTIWEAELLRLHFDPKVRDAVKGMAKNVAEVR